jgi:flavin-binding protein dodecin
MGAESMPGRRGLLAGRRRLASYGAFPQPRGGTMPESVYKVIELVGTSSESWEKAAKAAIERAAKTLRDLRVAEVTDLDITLKNGKVESYRAKVKVSFKYERD